MSNNPISPFRIIDWNVVNFEYERGMFFIPDNLPHQWTIKAHIEKLKATEDALQAIVDIAFTLLRKQKKHLTVFLRRALW